jgi:hypothetical protein
MQWDCEMKTILLDYKTTENGEVIYPDDISTISNTRQTPEGKWIAEYSGGLNLPIYIPPAATLSRVITLIEFESRFPMRVQLLLADPSLASSIEISSVCSLLARRIALSQARTPNGDRGVELENDMTKQGVQEAVRLGVMTQDEADAVLK